MNEGVAVLSTCGANADVLAPPPTNKQQKGKGEGTGKAKEVEG